MSTCSNYGFVKDEIATEKRNGEGMKKKPVKKPIKKTRKPKPKGTY